MIINIFGEIGWDVTAKEIQEQLNNNEDEKVKVIISSGGGSAFEGLMIYDMLKASGKEIETVIMGLAASAASVVFMSGSVRTMGEASLLMVHNSWSCFIGNAEEIRQELGTLDAIDTRMTKIFTNATGLSEEEVRALLSNETFMGIEEATEKGFATGMTESLEIAASVYNSYKTRKEAKEMAEDKKEQPEEGSEKEMGLFARFLAWLNAENNNEPKAQDDPEEEPSAGDDEEEEPQAGPQLSSLLDNAIEDMVTEEMPREDIISSIASASGIEEGTVNQIVAGEIDCPPEERLEGFAEVLDISMSSIMEAWAADGCSMPEEEEEAQDTEEVSALKAKITELEEAAVAKSKEDEKAFALLGALSESKITMHEANVLASKSLEEITAYVSEKSVNATGLGKPSSEPSEEDTPEDKHAEWKALLNDGKIAEAQAYYKANRDEIRKHKEG